MSILLDQLTKCFGAHCVVSNLSLEIPDGELFVLLGPSGSGKSTVLRLIAGLLETDGGRILLRGRDVGPVAPQRRGVGFVFQHYALFRHMSVADNIEFPLRIRHVKADARRRRRDELLELVGLVGLEKRLPSQLSGGQQQRVALARALAHRPQVLLLDEPFGALDAKIRAELRRFLRRIQSELNVTTIFVTHDQEEAFELADRLGVMNYGHLLEVGPPAELYLHPQTEFVATFLGKANLMVGECNATGVRLGPVHLPLDPHVTSRAGGRRVQVLFRPEDVAIRERPEMMTHPSLGRAVIEEVGFTGSLERIRLRLPALRGVRTIAPPAPFGADYALIEATRSQAQSRQAPLRTGTRVWVGVRRIHALTHPGMSFLVVTDGSPVGADAVGLAGHLARQAHARLTVLRVGPDESAARADLEAARERIGAGPAALELRSSPEDRAAAIAREAARQPYELVIHARPGNGVVETAEAVLGTQEHHLLLVPDSCAVPRNVLVCVSVGESGKEDVRFAGRLVRHLGAAVTLMTVVAEEDAERGTEAGERFLAACARTLAHLGLESREVLRVGRTRLLVSRELQEGEYDLVVLGAPAPVPPGRVRLGSLGGRLLTELKGVPVLVVRSQASSEEV